MGVMVFLRRRDNRPDATLLTELKEATGLQGKLLAHATGPRAELLAFAHRFAYRLADGQWRSVGWHQVRSGGWKSEREEIHWRLNDGSRDAVQLTEPGAFPQVFRERVQASIAVEDQFDVPGGGSISITARRDLGEEQPRLYWQVNAVRGAKLTDPTTKALADEALARLRADYEF